MIIIGSKTAEGELDRKSQRRAKRKKEEAIYNIKSFAINIATTVVIVFLCLTFVFGIYIQHGEDMYPRVRDGDLALFYRIGKDYEIGDVLTFHENETRRTARYIAMAGDVIDITDEGQLIINDSIQQEEIFYATFQMESDIEYPYTVPENCVYVLGDFRTEAMDSRVFGAIQKSDVDGTVITIIRRRGI